MGGRVIIVVIVLVVAFLVVSWMLGEVLRQRKPPRR
jgi:uncharacterized membrane protein YdbT with pleckstrin-like domain